MDKLFASWLALVIVSLAASTARADADSDRPHSIASISVCSPTATGASVSCPSDIGDTRQAVLAPDGSFPLNNYGGLGTLADEHSTIFPPGTLPGHSDYLFFVATAIQELWLPVRELRGFSPRITTCHARTDGAYPRKSSVRGAHLLIRRRWAATTTTAGIHRLCPLIRSPAVSRLAGTFFT